MSWIITLEEDPATGDLVLPFPPDLLDEAGWKEGDVLTWTVNEDNTIILTKKEANADV